MHQITPYLKNKYPFLNHLKIGSLFFFVEIDMKQIVSNHTLKNFHNILKSIIIRQIYIKEEKNEIINILNQQDLNMTDFKYIEIIVSNEKKIVDFNIIQKY